MTSDPWTGYPPDPAVSGWHWLRCSGYSVEKFWHNDVQKWSGNRGLSVLSGFDADLATEYYDYDRPFHATESGPLPEPAMDGDGM